MYFFFSYARADRDQHLERFFDDLTKRVAALATLPVEEVCFLDVIDIDVGDRWPQRLTEALSTSAVLVSIYTTSYFRRPTCGKEFQVFLQRRGPDAIPTGILPVQWPTREWFCKSGLPPQAVRHIQWLNNRLPGKYHERGMQSLTWSRRGLYRQCVETFAQRIVRLAEDDPTPPFPGQLRLEEIRDAFGGAPVEVAAGAATVLVSFLTRAPSEGWRPFVASQRSVRDIVDAIDAEGFRFDEADPREDLVAMVDRAETECRIPVVVVDPAMLGDAEVEQRLIRLLGSQHDNFHVFLLSDPDGGEAFGLPNALRRGGQTPPGRLLPVYSDRSFFLHLVGFLSDARRRIVSETAQGIDEGARFPVVQGPGGAA